MRNGDFDVYIKMSGQRVEEYSTVREGEQLTSCYIASEEGKTFSIHCRPNAKTDSYRAEFRVDGRILYSCHAQPGRMIMSVGPSVEGNYRPYQFSRLLVNADDEAEGNVQNLDALGSIEVRLWRVTYSLGGYKERRGTRYDASEIGVVHERSKKAGSHCVSFGADVPIVGRRHKLIDRKFVDPRDTPRYVFRFQYRSQDILRAQEIIPRIPRPSLSAQSKSKVPVEASTSRAMLGKRKRREGIEDVPEVKTEIDLTSDVEDPEVLQVQLQAIQARMEKAKSRSAGRVKRERSSIKLETAGDIIDLTSD